MLSFRKYGRNTHTSHLYVFRTKVEAHFSSMDTQLLLYRIFPIHDMIKTTIWNNVYVCVDKRVKKIHLSFNSRSAVYLCLANAERDKLESILNILFQLEY